MIDISEYENEPNIRFMDIYPDALDNDLSKVNNFLYHAILKYNDYEILENIFKERNIYALKYVMEFAKQYSFNANEGKYVSLLSLDKNQ